MSTESLESMGCPTDCSPTFNMLAHSEVPETFGDQDGNFNFGDVEGASHPQPGSSLCNSDGLENM